MPGGTFPTLLEHARRLYETGEWTLERFQAEVDALFANDMADYRAPSWAGPFDLPLRVFAAPGGAPPDRGRA